MRLEQSKILLSSWDLHQGYFELMDILPNKLLSKIELSLSLTYSLGECPKSTLVRNTESLLTVVFG